MELSPYERIFGELPGTKKRRKAIVEDDLALEAGRQRIRDQAASEQRTTAERDAIDRMALKVLDDNPNSGMSYDTARIEAGKRVRDMQFNRGLADATTARNEQLKAEGAQPQMHTLGGAETTEQLAKSRLSTAQAVEDLDSGIPARRMRNVLDREKSLEELKSGIEAQGMRNYADKMDATLRGVVAAARMGTAGPAAAAQDTLGLDTALTLGAKARAERPGIAALTTATQAADIAEANAAKVGAEGKSDLQPFVNDTERQRLAAEFERNKYAAQHPEYLRQFNPLNGIPNFQQALMLSDWMNNGKNAPTTATPAPTTPDSLNSAPMRFKSTGQVLR